MMKIFVWLIVILTCLFFGCTSKKEDQPAAVPSKVLGKIVTGRNAAPVVTMLTAANAPKVLKAEKPARVPLTYPYGVGVPDFTNYTITDGLPNNDISSSAIDKEGNLWFATNGGLSKYDGVNFTNYNTVNGLASDFTHKVFVDSKNKIWITTIDKGVSIFDGRSFDNHDVVKISYDEDFMNIREVLEDNKGIIWLNTVDGLYKYIDEKFTKITMGDTLVDKSIKNIIQDKKGNLLITTGNGIKIFDGKAFSPFTKIPELGGKDSSSLNTSQRITLRAPMLLYCDSKGTLWFTYYFSGGLGSYDGKQIKMYHELDNLNINQIVEDKSGNFWIAGSEGLTKFDGTRFIIYNSKDGLPETIVRALTADGENNIWASTGNGISKVSYSNLSGLEVPDATSPPSLTLDRSGNKWIVTRSGLGKYNADHIDFYGKELLTDGHRMIVYSAADHAGNVWFYIRDYKSATPSMDLIKFDGNNYTVYGKEQGLFLSNSIRPIWVDNQGNIWNQCDNGIAKFENNSFTLYDAPKDLLIYISAFFQDSKGQYWFGSINKGVYKFDGHRFTLYDTHDGLPHNFINGIAEDPMGNIWLATDGGSAKFDGKTFTSYRAKEGLDNTSGQVIYDSVNQCIWFSTNLGIASLKMDEVGKNTPFFQHYNQRMGFNLGSSGMNSLRVDTRGVLWTRDLYKGISAFDYKATSELKPLSIRIKNIKLDNKNINWNSLRKGAYPVGVKDSLTAINEMALKFGKAFSEEDFSTMNNAFGKVSYDSIEGSDFIPVNLILPIKNNNINFEFGTISPSFGKAVQYQYKLEEYDKGWSELSTKTDASFGNMSEGNYTFHVKALSPFGSWSETSYSFIVLPPWYRTWWAYALYTLLSLSGVLFFISWRTKALKQEKLLLEQKVAIRTTELNQSLENLKSTQSQLIQSEKMASLGELTAGIAHEIQNPLNFVNNFSSLNTELVSEAREAISSGNLGDAEEILGNIADNEEKIHHHGKRADAIVKGMLQHSQKSSGVKEPTNINALADEYLRLAYHGLRAKDKSFNSTIKTELDQSIGNINIIPQDIGRVLLNLINNAFYAVNEKKNQLGESYEPEVTVSTRMDSTSKNQPISQLENWVIISVRDNGNGIPQKILDKIFQPFFTTKPTGLGTGLGLSLSYDIIKAHSGEIKVNTQQGEGTEFIIQLPMN